MSAKNGGRSSKSAKEKRADTKAEEELKEKLIEEAKAKAITDKENDDEKRAIDSYNNYIARNAIKFNINKPKEGEYDDEYYRELFHMAMIILGLEFEYTRQSTYNRPFNIKEKLNEFKDTNKQLIQFEIELLDFKNKNNNIKKGDYYTPDFKSRLSVLMNNILVKALGIGGKKKPKPKLKPKPK
jgi:hypothetical protein